MNRYNTIIPNDVTNGEGVCVSFFVQGCPHHCPNCFNKETWDFNSGYEYTAETKREIVKLISANNIIRNFSILGGEPLAPQNLEMVEEIISTVRTTYPNIEITLWTGYDFLKLDKKNPHISSILKHINKIIDGKFIEELKDLSLHLRGSSNQKIWLKGADGIWR